MDSPAALNAGAYTAQYEALRAQMTAGDARGGAPGASGAGASGAGASGAGASGAGASGAGASGAGASGAGASGAGASGAGARGIALGVLIQDGLPAWLAVVEPMLAMRAAVAVDSPLERRAAAQMQPTPAVAPDVLPPAKQGEVTLLLAALVLSTARVARRDPSPARMREGACR